MRKYCYLFLLVGLFPFAIAGCGQPETPTPDLVTPEPTLRAPTQVPEPVIEEQEGEEAMPFELTSSAFIQGESIPIRYTCDGEDISPPLQWGEPPDGTQSFALIADDPDAPVGTWVHWVIYNLPGETRSLEEAISADAERTDGSRHGTNSWGRLGYGGPCPPSGTHRYFFKLYALDVVFDLEAGSTKEDLLTMMEGHILGQMELLGTYSR